MKTTAPPINPNQLPPESDDYLFINATLEMVGPVEFDVEGGPGPIDVVHVPPASTVVLRSPAPYQAQHVTCHAHVNTTDYVFEFGPPDVPEGYWISSLHCGLRAGYSGGYVPFAVAIVTDGVNVETIALDE